MELTRELVERFVKESREICGCHQCVGGYDIGGRTIAMGAAPMGLQAYPQRPYGCLADTLLKDLLDDARRR